MVFLAFLGIIAMLLNSAQRIKCYLEVSPIDDEMILYDFTKNHTNEGWLEQSDTFREVGMSKAILSMQSTRKFNRAILFTLLNPQPNGACFAGVRKITSFNLHKYKNLTLKIRGQGENYNYKIVLQHKNKNDEPNPMYEHFFTAPSKKFNIVSLSLSKFKSYCRGKEQNNTEPLDKSFITSFGIQIYGGVYLPLKQSGTASLEIDWIKATK